MGDQGRVGPGSEIDGFVIEAVGGRGGMGVVYRARQKQPDRTVALKVIAVDLADDPQFRARFRRESAIAAQIEHPNVIPVHAVGEAGGILYIAMRFIQGIDMRTLLVQEGQLDPQRAATIVDQVAQALDAAHQYGLVHRDVKPANILISSVSGRDHVYLTDFGLSRHIEGSQALTGTGAFLGTIDYVAPEQARGERVDARTDVYSLGCVLFQALTGRVPFPMDNELAKLYAHDTKPPPSVLEMVPHIPAAFDAVVSRALAKAPDDRYLSAGDLGRASLAASSGARVTRAERSVAVGAAAPDDAGVVPAQSSAPAAEQKPAATALAKPNSLPAAETAPSPEPAPAAAPPAGAPAGAKPSRFQKRRAWLLGGVALLAVVAVVAIVIATSSGGGTSPASVINVNPVAATGLAPIPGLEVLETRRTDAPGQYHYMLDLSRVTPPSTASASTPVPYYLTLWVRRGSERLVRVERLKLPFPFTASSALVDFGLSPSNDGEASASLEYYVKQGDSNAVTHYFTISPTQIKIDS